MFACQKQNNKEHYKKSKLYCNLTNNILENYRMLESTSFFVGFSVLCYVYFGTIKHSEQKSFCVCVHFMCIQTANQLSFNKHLSILLQIDLTTLAMCSFNGSFSYISSDLFKQFKASAYSCNSIKQMAIILSVVARPETFSQFI